MLKTEGILNPRAMQAMGKQELDYRNRTGLVPAPNQLTVNVPVSVEGNKKLASHLRSEIESTVIRVIREHS
jgi:hypothetical protein